MSHVARKIGLEPPFCSELEIYMAVKCELYSLYYLPTCVAYCVDSQEVQIMWNIPTLHLLLPSAI